MLADLAIFIFGVMIGAMMMGWLAEANDREEIETARIEGKLKGLELAEKIKEEKYGE